MILTFDQIHQYFELRLGKRLSTRDKVAVRCPFHEDRNASATVFLNGNGGFNCQSCSAKGNIFQFEMLFSKCSLSEAKKNISEITGARMDQGGQRGPVTAVYDYRNTNGSVVFQKRRHEPPNDKKTFVIYHPTGGGSWAPGIGDDTKKVLYNLPSLITCNLALLAEGEKDCGTLESLALFSDVPEIRVAVTTNFEGAWQPGHYPKWLDQYSPYFTGKHVIIFEDNDESGRVWAEYVARQVYPYADSVRRISFTDLPEKGDVTDWMENRKKEDLENLIKATPRWENPKVEIPPMSQDAVEFASEETQPVEWIIENIIPTSGNGIICGDPKASKAQPVDCGVLTPNGWKDMGDIEVGDFVIGVNGESVKVLATHPQGVKQCYRINISDGTSTEATGDHLWKVESHNNRQRGQMGRVVTTLQLAEMVKYPKNRDTHIPIAAPVRYQTKNYAVSPYTIGVLLGDGGMSQHGTTLTQYQAPEMIERLKNECPKGYQLVKWKAELVWAFTSIDEIYGAFWRLLDVYGLARKKSPQKFIPEVYLRGDVTQRLALLQGLLDTDGMVAHGKTGGAKIIFGTASPLLARDIQELVQSLGGTAIVKHWTNITYLDKNKQRHKALDSYGVAIKLPRELGCPFFISRKAQLWKSSSCGKKKIPCRRIVGVEYSRDAEAKCITVDSPDGLYVTEHHIVTHNSYHAMDIAISLACGENWLGNKVNRRVRTYLVSREDAPGITQRRIGRLVRGNAIYAERLEGWMRINTRRHTADFKVTNQEHMDTLIGEIKRFGSELCILDVFRSVHESEENDNDAMPAVLAKVNRIQSECNCAVMLVHHLNKSTPENIFKGLRGASAIHGWMEWGIGISVTNPDEEDKHKWIRKLEFENKEGVCMPIFSQISGNNPDVVKIIRVDSYVSTPSPSRPTISNGNYQKKKKDSGPTQQAMYQED